MVTSVNCTFDTSLDTQSTSEPQPPSSFREFLTAGQETELSKIRLLYSTLDMSGYSSDSIDRQNNCRTNARFAVDISTRLVKVLASSCNLRFCPFCLQSKAKIQYHRTLKIINSMKDPKFLTLTLKSTKNPLSEEIAKIYRAFRNFRRWLRRENFSFSGIYFLQITYNKNTGLWHPHLHSVIDIPYISQKRISETWCRITDGSPIVDIRQIRNPSETAKYVARYATVCVNLKKLPACKLLELFFTIKNKRLVNKFGKVLSNKQIEELSNPKEKPLIICSWTMLVSLVNYYAEAETLYTCWLKKEPLPDEFNLNCFEQILNNSTVEKRPKEEPPWFLDFY